MLRDGSRWLSWQWGRSQWITFPHQSRDDGIHVRKGWRGGRRETTFLSALSTLLTNAKGTDIGCGRWARSSINALKSLMVFSNRALCVRSRGGYPKGVPLPKVPNLLLNTRRKWDIPRYSLPGNLVQQVIPMHDKIRSIASTLN